MSVIEVAHLTKDYGHGRGVFDVSIDVNKGECYGFLGPNGAGKTTTIRHLMGFSKPDKGSTAINGLNSWEQPAVIQGRISPGRDRASIRNYRHRVPEYDERNASYER